MRRCSQAWRAAQRRAGRLQAPGWPSRLEALGAQALLVRLDQRLAARGLGAVRGGALVAGRLRVAREQRA